MKKVIVILTVLAMLAILAGCRIEETLDRAEDRIEGGKSASEVTLTKEQAEEIALKDAGVTREQVKNLRTSYEFDDGVPQYEIEFYVGDFEYDYEIHADSGKILSFEKDSIHD